MAEPRPGGSLRDVGSLAYWLGVYGPCEDRELLAVARAMTWHYDYEDQAEAYGSALPDAEWTQVFTPIAPVQLTPGWSPLARAGELVGRPATEPADDAGAQPVVAAWTTAQVAVTTTAVVARASRAPSAPAYERRFAALLAAAFDRATRQQRGVALITQRGWSYEHVHTPSARTEQLMTDAGFVVTTRRPPA